MEGEFLRAHFSADSIRISIKANILELFHEDIRGGNLAMHHNIEVHDICSSKPGTIGRTFQIMTLGLGIKLNSHLYLGIYIWVIWVSKWLLWKKKVHPSLSPLFISNSPRDVTGILQGLSKPEAWLPLV